jgi:hypothetical protein
MKSFLSFKSLILGANLNPNNCIKAIHDR